MLIRRKLFNPVRTKPRRGPERCPAYLAWIRTLCCVVCGQATGQFIRIEAAHTTVLGARGFGQRSSDFSAIPLCGWDHRVGPASYHRLGERKFAERHGIDLRELVSALNTLYESRTKDE